MDRNKVVACIGGALGTCGIAYLIYNSIKINKVCKKMNTTIDQLADEIEIDISESIVEAAVQQAIDKEVTKIAIVEANKVSKAIQRDVHDQIKTAVDVSYSELKEKISKDMAKQAANINIQELKDKVRAEAEEKILEKFDHELDDISEKFNKNLDNVGKIYQSIADTMNKSK